jgi:predicted ribosome quality control (RQC) complex YloA/Tae2 family protein
VIRNYFTLKSLAAEINARLAGGFIDEVFTQDKNELRLIIFKDNVPFAIVCRTDATDAALYLVRESARARRNTVSLMPPLIGTQIKSCVVSKKDRILYLETTNGLRVAFQMFSAKANVFLLLKNDEITESFKHSSDHDGKPLAERDTPDIDDEIRRLLASEETFAAHLGTSEPLEKKLAQRLLAIDKTLAAEIVYRAKTKTLFEATASVYHDLQHPSPRVYLSKGRVVRFSLLDETVTPHDDVQHFDSVSEAISYFIHKTYQQETFAGEFEAFKKKLADAIKKQTALIATMTAALDNDRSEPAEQKGNLLLSNLWKIRKGMTKVDVENYYANSEALSITLDPAKTPAENAAFYFEKSKKAKRNREVALARLARIKQDVEKLSQVSERFVVVADAKALEKFKKENAAVMKRFALTTKAQTDEQRLFKKFPIAPDVELWVGKNAKNNELLTFQYARPNDLWLHAKGASGSHAVIKSGRMVRPQEIELAAAIAAYYSSARGSEFVPVIVVQKKFVRRAKGGNMGSVIVEREEVVLAKPAVPVREQGE